MGGDRDRAIAAMKEARRTHVEWAEWLSHPAVRDCDCADCTTTKRVAGSIEHHLRYIEDYDNVLAVFGA